MTTTLSVSGMTCGHCKKAVQTALTSVDGVTSVDINLEEGLAKVEGYALFTELQSAIEDKGYEARLIEAS